jgi:hypothetical protein
MGGRRPGLCRARPFIHERPHGIRPIAFVDGAWETKPTFWLPEEGLVEKSRADRVPYDLWHDQGFLETTPGKSVEYEFVAHWLFDFCQSHNVKKIAFDRWGMKYLKPWLLAAGFTEERITETLFAPFGQGFPVHVAGSSRSWNRRCWRKRFVTEIIPC